MRAAGSPAGGGSTSSGLWARLRARGNRGGFEPPRRLTTTGTGRAVLGIAIAAGLAALNTGNNLLFFGWGLVLASIVVSGIMSETTLRGASVRMRAIPELRVNEAAQLPVVVSNTRRLPAFAVELAVVMDAPRGTGGDVRSHTGAALRLDAHAVQELQLALVPQARGAHRVRYVSVATAFPFGFFRKEKRTTVDAGKDLVVFPARVELGAQKRALLARLGESPAHKAGAGDDLFSLRTFRAGDEPRRVLWRRAARTGRLYVREPEATESRDVILEVRLPPLTTAAGAPDAAALALAERTLAAAASLAEDLLAAGHAVGVRAPGTALVPAPGPRQRQAILHHLALLQADAPLLDLHVRRAVRVGVVAHGASAAGVDVVVAVDA